ncbi:MAG: hypothetical protein AAF657_08110, partial [Acidobacteriota bacterium]
MMYPESEKTRPNEETLSSVSWATAEGTGAVAEGAGAATPRRTAHGTDPDPSAYESLTGKLLAYRERSRNNVILVTSAVTGDGTSTVARNCATTLGKGLSQRVVLVDANL